MRLLPKPGLILLLASLATALFIATAPGTTRPILPILGTPAWTSWYDAYLGLPVLAALIALVLDNFGWFEGAILGSLAIIPMIAQEFYSYFWAVNYSVAAWYGEFITGILVSVFLTYLFFLAPRLNWRRGLGGARRSRLLVVSSGVSLALALGEILLRPLTTSGVPLNSVGDIGITNAWGGYDLLHGVNPFVTGLPPWGGPVAPPYGPVAVLFAAPFSLLPVDAAAHLSSVVFLLLSALMIFAIVRLFNPVLAAPMALLFVSIPLTMWSIVAAVSPHFMVTFLILLTLYLYLKSMPIFSGVALALSFLTLSFPVLLLIPFLMFGGRGRAKFLLSFTGCSLVGGVIYLVMLSHRTYTAGVHAVSQGGIEFVTYTLFLHEALGLEVFFLLLILLSAFVWMYLGVQTPQSTRLLLGCAVMLLFIPAMIGFTYGAFYLWSVAVSLVALASLPQMRAKPIQGDAKVGEAGIGDPLTKEGAQGLSSD